MKWNLDNWSEGAHLGLAALAKHRSISLRYPFKYPDLSRLIIASPFGPISVQSIAGLPKLNLPEFTMRGNTKSKFNSNINASHVDFATIFKFYAFLSGTPNLLLFRTALFALLYFKVINQ